MATDDRWGPFEPGKFGTSQKILVERSGGTVKLMKFEAGASFPAHTHPDRTEWIWVVEGQVETEVDGAVIRLGPGDFRIFPRQSRHRLAASAPALALAGALKDL